jgi:hypothetical protein
MGRRVRDGSFEHCAYCGALLPFNKGILAWRVGARFVCNEFCGDGIAGEDEIGAAPQLFAPSERAANEGSAQGDSATCTTSLDARRSP